MSKKSFTVYFGDGSKDKTFATAKEARERVLAIRNARAQDDNDPPPQTKKEKAEEAASEAPTKAYPVASEAATPKKTH